MIDKVYRPWCKWSIDLGDTYFSTYSEALDSLRVCIDKEIIPFFGVKEGTFERMLNKHYGVHECQVL